jgi:hypothetical protein
MDECEAYGVGRQIPIECIARLDGAANHLMMRGELVTETIEPTSPDVVVVHAGLKYINSSHNEPSAGYYIEMPESTWAWLPRLQDLIDTAGSS